MQSFVDPQLFGQHIRRLRQEAGWSQDALGEKIGTHQANISLIEAGKPAALSDDQRARLCAALGIEPTAAKWAERKPRPHNGDPALVTTDEAAAMLGLTRSTFATGRSKGRFTLPVAVLGRPNLYWREDIEWLIDQQAERPKFDSLIVGSDLTVRGLAHVLGIHPGTIACYRSRDTGRVPQATGRRGQNLVWDVATVSDWIDGMVAGPRQRLGELAPMRPGIRAQAFTEAADEIQADEAKYHQGQPAGFYEGLRHAAALVRSEGTLAH